MFRQRLAFAKHLSTEMAGQLHMHVYRLTNHDIHHHIVKLEVLIRIQRTSLWLTSASQTIIQFFVLECVRIFISRAYGLNRMVAVRLAR